MNDAYERAAGDLYHPVTSVDGVTEPYRRTRPQDIASLIENNQLILALKLKERQQETEVGGGDLDNNF